VPGITSGRGSGIGGYGTRYFRNETLVDRLGDLGIPDDEVDNYVEALQAGRSVVAYFAKPESVAQVTDIFRGSGLVKVKTF
jgi:tRNA A58 N-methylase Trm61